MDMKVCTTSSSSGRKNKFAPPSASSVPHSAFSGIKSKLQETEGAKWARAAPRSGLKQLPHFLPGRTTLFQRTTILWKVQADRGVRSKTRVLNNDIAKLKGKFIFTRKIPSQRLREIWRLILWFQRYMTVTKEPENGGRRQQPTGSWSLKPYMWSGAHLPEGQAQVRGQKQVGELKAGPTVRIKGQGY